MIIEYFKNHPKMDLKHEPVVDWIKELYVQLTGKKPKTLSFYMKELSKTIEQYRKVFRALLELAQKGLSSTFISCTT